MGNKTFTGFSTAAASSGKRTWVLHDIELIKRDLRNHFFTRIGERVMRPDFGSRLWEYIMEPNVTGMAGVIRAEVERVVRLDTRLDVRDIAVFDEGHQVTVSMDLLYVPFRSVETFVLEFDKRQGVM